MRVEEIRAELEQAACHTWGAERCEALRSALDGSARMFHLLLQAPLTSADDGPDFPTPIGQAEMGA
jgi:hypothetical protein